MSPFTTPTLHLRNFSFQQHQLSLWKLSLYRVNFTLLPLRSLNNNKKSIFDYFVFMFAQRVCLQTRLVPVITILHPRVHVNSSWDVSRKSRAHHMHLMWEETCRLPGGTQSVGDTWPGFSEENAALPTTGLGERDVCRSRKKIVKRSKKLFK